MYVVSSCGKEMTESKQVTACTVVYDSFSDPHLYGKVLTSTSVIGNEKLKYQYRPKSIFVQNVVSMLN